ncbi:MAG: ABC transporter permease [Herpetosiphonaceae bacterium]|nr:ABC transporter permease [Herpetosiphonaceae bacterium]
MAHLESNRSGSARRFTGRFLTEDSPLHLPGSDAWLVGIIVVVLLGAWEGAARAGLISALFFPPPSVIAASATALVRDGTLPMNMAVTLERLLFGMLLGGIPGLLLGQLLGRSPRLRAVINPFFAAAHPIPKIAILPLIMIIFGIGEAPKVIVAATGAFFPMLINTMTGVQQINPIHFEVAQNYGASRWKVFTRVILPGSLPFMLAGLLLALNVTLLLTIAVEMVSSQTGLGAMIWLAWETMHVEDLYSALAVITLFGIGFNFALQHLRKRLVPWEVAT